MSLSSTMNSRLSRVMPPSLKLAMTLSVMILASAIPLEHWPAQGLLLALTFIGLSVDEVSIAYLTRRLCQFLPILLILGLSIPLTQTDNPAAWSWMVSLWLRCLVCFLAGLWLIHVLPFPELLSTLLRWRCPQTLVAMLAFMYRYIFILWDELTRLRQARDARDFGRSTSRLQLAGTAQLIGLLLLRAMERAERTHKAMLSRGWNGSMHFIGDEPRS